MGIFSFTSNSLTPKGVTGSDRNSGPGMMDRAPAEIIPTDKSPIFIHLVLDIFRIQYKVACQIILL